MGNFGKDTFDDLGMRNLSLAWVLLLIFIPTSLFMVVYIQAGKFVQDRVPSLLLFCLLAMIVLFPIQLLVILTASKKEHGQYSLKSAFAYHQKLSWWKIILYGALLWGFAGIMSVTILPLEEMLLAPVAERLTHLMPPYFDWTNMDYLQRYPRNILLLTCVVYFVVNGLIGPVVEELFFRGYLTAKVSRLGDYAPLVITLFFSLYHLWLPFNNVFRIIIFFAAAYVAWKQKNIYIAIVFHCLSNLFSAVIFAVSVFAVLS